MMIQKYEDWMRPQVVELFNLEYGTPMDEFNLLFGLFYEHPFQKEHCIRIVAVEGGKVAGFQSFFYWPIMHNGALIRSYQSGNSLVHKDFRGQGLFAKMLNFIHQEDSGFNCELLIGFPVEASYNSFIRNKWLNPFNLEWYVKPLNPLRSVFSNPEKQLRKLLGTHLQQDFTIRDNITFVAQTSPFDAYRFSYEKGDFYRFSWKENGMEAFFEMKAQRRKGIIKELVIGKFLTTEQSDEFVLSAFRALIKLVRRSSNFTMISCAVNPQVHTLTKALTNAGFRKLDRKIYFIAKGPLAENITDWSKWWIFRSDIDTW